MRHLKPEELLDVAEGTRPAAAFPHLAACPECERQVASLRDTAATALGAEVPEPSPLYWDHLSARVRGAVAEERAGGPRESWWTSLGWWKAAAAAGALAVLVLAAVPALRPADEPVDVDASATAVVDDGAAGALPAFDDDPALALLADLSAEMDWEAASEAGLVPSRGAVDRVLFTLTAEERLELQRILEEALSSGA